jgi:5'-3' exonuclease
MPDVKVIRLPNLEADFVPYYLLSRKKVPYDGVTGQIIYSNDHDLWQCASKDTYIFSKSASSKKIIKPGTVMRTYLKKDNSIEDIYLPLAMSVIGDTGDDVDGVKNVGPSRFLELFDELISLTGNMKEIYNKVENNKPLLNSIPKSTVNKYLKKVIDAEVKDKVISNNLKLVSFELISRAIDNPVTTELLEKRKIIEKIMDDNEIYPLESLKNALEKSGVFLGESSIDFLYIL